MRRRGKNERAIKAVLSTLIAGEPMDVEYRDHILTGNYRGRRECHIEPDWLLIYRLEDGEITFERTGTHSDLFR